MAIKKSELYSSLWASRDELRGGMDALYNSPLNALSRIDGIPLAEFILSVAEGLGDDVNADKTQPLPPLRSTLQSAPKGEAFGIDHFISADKAIGQKPLKVESSPLGEDVRHLRRT